MNKTKVNSIVKWIIPVILLLVHVFYIQKLPVYNIRIALHWGCYLFLFFYLLYKGEVKQVFCEFQQSIGKLHFLVKVIAYFLSAFIAFMFVVFNFSKDLMIMYPLWQPFSPTGLVFWAIVYIFLQPLVDNIIYHKWMIGNNDEKSSRILIFVIAMLRTFVETGVVIYSKDYEIPKEGFLALALWVAMCAFALSYAMHKNVALTYTVEVMYRIALAMTVFIGMSQFYIPTW